MRKKTFNSSDVADILGVAKRTASNYLQNGVIPATQHPLTGSWSVDLSELVAFMKGKGMDTGHLETGLQVLILDAAAHETVRMLEQVLPESRFTSVQDPYAIALDLCKEEWDLLVLNAWNHENELLRFIALLRERTHYKRLPVLVVTNEENQRDRFKTLDKVRVVLGHWNLSDWTQSLGSLFPEHVAHPQTDL